MPKTVLLLAFLATASLAAAQSPSAGDAPRVIAQPEGPKDYQAVVVEGATVRPEARTPDEALMKEIRTPEGFGLASSRRISSSRA